MKRSQHQKRVPQQYRSTWGSVDSRSLPRTFDDETRKAHVRLSTLTILAPTTTTAERRIFFFFAALKYRGLDLFFSCAFFFFVAAPIAFMLPIDILWRVMIAIAVAMLPTMVLTTLTTTTRHRARNVTIDWLAPGLTPETADLFAKLYFSLLELDEGGYSAEAYTRRWTYLYEVAADRIERLPAHSLDKHPRTR